MRSLSVVVVCFSVVCSFSDCSCGPPSVVPIPEVIVRGLVFQVVVLTVPLNGMSGRQGTVVVP
jgi:hypothetical protein